MTNLHIIAYNADEVLRKRAVNALTQAGIRVEDAWLDPRTTDDIHNAQAEPALTRDPVGIAVGLLFAIPFGALAGWLIWLGGLWWAGAVPALVVALFGAVGLTDSLIKKERGIEVV